MTNFSLGMLYFLIALPTSSSEMPYNKYTIYNKTITHKENNSLVEGTEHV